jgi:geranylgeranyl diphosphate synthase type I
VEPPEALEPIRTRVDSLLKGFLFDERAELEHEHPAVLPLIDEIRRLVASGGKRLRPAFCVCGYRAGGGADEEAILRVGAALELFHTFALVHDDVMDRGEVRRGEPTIHVRMAKDRADGGPDQADWFGVSVAILAGDFASVLADHLFMTSGFPPALLVKAFRRYSRMRVEVAVGQFLDISGSGRDVGEEQARRISLLKSGSYTIRGPLAIGAILAEAPPEVRTVLDDYGSALGEAFQLRDDLAGVLAGDLEQAKPTALMAAARRRVSSDDREFLTERLGRGALAEPDRVRALEILRTSGAVQECEDRAAALIDRAVAALDPHVLGEEPTAALTALAEGLRALA